MKKLLALLLCLTLVFGLVACTTGTPSATMRMQRHGGAGDGQRRHGHAG